MKRKSLVVTVMQPTVVNKDNVDSCEKCGMMNSENCNTCAVINKDVMPDTCCGVYKEEPAMITMRCKVCGAEFSGTEKIDICPSCYM